MRKWLKDLRVGKGYTMRDMGQKLGISESYYCSIEGGGRQKKLDLVTASRLATVLEISIAEVVNHEAKKDE